MTVYDDVQFWALVINESKRTIVCSPELESRIKTQIDARGLAGVITVQPSRLCPEGQVLVIDEGALEAGIRESIQTELNTRSKRWI